MTKTIHRKAESKPTLPFYELRALPVGSFFEVVGLEECYRKLQLISITDSAAGVKGESAIDDFSVEENKAGEVIKKRNWTALSPAWTMSPRTPVRPISLQKSA